MNKDYEKCLKYIDNYWKKATFSFPRDKGLYIGLPNKFVAPNHILFVNDQFYWDSYFIILGLVASGKVNLARGMVENFVYIYKRFNAIPPRNRFYNFGISQPPFLTSMILKVFSITKDRKWLRNVSKTAEGELKNYWLDTKEIGKHLVYQGLSRYCGHYRSDSVAEYESGWDMTSRFKEHCLDYLPVDLNTLLYKYEKDLAGIYKILNNRKKEKYYLRQAAKRKKVIYKLMWNNKKGFFFDYNYKEKKRSNFYSLAGFYPLWAKLVSNKEAKKIRKNIKKFECNGGLANTQKTGLFKGFKQWDYPNGWPNQQWIVIKGLFNYGFEEDAKRLAIKWLNLNKKMFLKTGKFWEKYDVVKGDIGKPSDYPTQEGFGWTNGIFVRLVEELKKK